MHRESLDDAIDRVAREMTACRAPAGVSARVRHRITGSPRWSPSVALLAATAAVAVIAGTASIWNGNPARPVRVSAPAPAAALASHSRPALIPLARSAKPATIGRMEGQPAAGPAPLEIVPLEIEPIVLATLPEAAPLDVEEIRVAGIDAGAVNKEWK